MTRSTVERCALTAAVAAAASRRRRSGSTETPTRSTALLRVASSAATDVNRAALDAEARTAVGARATTPPRGAGKRGAGRGGCGAGGESRRRWW